MTTIHLVGTSQRLYAKTCIDTAPDGYTVTIAQPKRSLDANARLWAMLADVARAMPEGRMHTPEIWKCLFMQACGHAVRFEMGLDNRPFPIGFSSSKLNKMDFSDLITAVMEYGDRNGVKWSEPNPYGDNQ